MSNISNFAANNPGLFARPNQFEVKFNGYGNNKTQRDLTINCNSANIPGLTMIAGDKDATYRSYIRQKVYDDVTFSFHVSSNYKELEYFQDWMKLMVDPVTNRLGYYKNYKGTITISNLYRNNSLAMQTILYDAFPKRISPLTVDYSTDGTMNLSVDVQYRSYKQQYYELAESDVEPVPYSTNLKKVRKDESLETFRERMGLQVPPEFRINQ